MRLRFGISKKIGNFHVGVSHSVGGRRKRHNRKRNNNNNDNVFGIVIAVLFLPITAAVIFGNGYTKKRRSRKQLTRIAFGISRHMESY